MAKKTQNKKKPLSLSRGNISVNGRYWTYEYFQNTNHQYTIQLTENKIVLNPVTTSEFRKVKQSLTVWNAKDPAKQKDLEKFLKAQIPEEEKKVVDGKIKDIEVIPTIIETEVVQEVPVVKNVEEYDSIIHDGFNVYCLLKPMQVRNYAKNYIITNVKN